MKLSGNQFSVNVSNIPVTVSVDEAKTQLTAALATSTFAATASATGSVTVTATAVLSGATAGVPQAVTLRFPSSLAGEEIERINDSLQTVS